MTTFNRFLLWPLLLLGHFLAVSLLAWHLLAQFNFAYPLGYQLLDINQHVDKYGPLNRFKSDFAQTTEDEQLEIFAAITQAVQHHGHGLADISYRLPNGSLTPLMHHAEIVHLQDVANLIDFFYCAGIAGGFIWLLLLVYAWQKKFAFPPLKKILAGFFISLIVIAIPGLMIGPTAVFYWLHEHIFPDGHQWFFFYQDSLMTTLMKAPDLFGFIGVILLMLFALLWSASVLAMTWMLNSRNSADK